jgi:hypothetical protein
MQVDTGEKLKGNKHRVRKKGTTEKEEEERSTGQA